MVDILFYKAFSRIVYSESDLRSIRMPLVGFTDDATRPMGLITLKVPFGAAFVGASGETQVVVVDIPLRTV